MAGTYRYTTLALTISTAILLSACGKQDEAVAPEAQSNVETSAQTQQSGAALQAPATESVNQIGRAHV